MVNLFRQVAGGIFHLKPAGGPDSLLGLLCLADVVNNSGSTWWVASRRSGWRWGGAAGLPSARAQTNLFPITQDYLVDAWRLDEVMPGSATTDVAQTPDGYLWIGSFEGVLRFDGKRFVLYTPEDTPQLPSTWVLKLFLDREGALWLGTGLGPVRIKNGIWEDLHRLPGWKGEPAFDIVQNAAGEIFLNTRTNLFRYRSDRFEEIAIPSPRGHVSIAFDDQDQMWLGTENLVAMRKDGRWQTVHASAVADPTISCIIASRDGGVWVHAGSEIRCWRHGQWERTLRIPARFSEDSVTLREDRQGCLWAGFFGHGLLGFFRDGRIGYCTLDEGLLNDATRGVFEDREGNIWAASNGGGLARLKPRRLRVFGKEEGLRQGVVNSAVETAPGQLLVATHGGGLVPFDGQRFASPLSMPDLHLHRDSWVLSGLKDASGSLWLSLYNVGLMHFQMKPEGLAYQATLDSPQVNCLFEDSRKQLWIGTLNGLGRLERNTVVLTTNALPAGQILALAEDAAKRLWVNVVEKGVYYTKTPGDPASFSPFPTGRLPAPLSLYGDKTGAMWVGHRSGVLGRVEGDRETVYGETEGMPKAHLASLIEDDTGNLWAGTDLGILRVSRLSLDAVQAGRTNRLSCNLFDRADGMQAMQCRKTFQPIAGRTADGHLWFATMQGLALVDPRQIAPRQVPTLWIEEMTLDSRKLTLKSAQTQSIVAPAGTRHLGVTFTGISLEVPERAVFQYQLNPLDTDWISLGKNRSVQLRDLRPGAYQFLVRAANDCSNWSAPVSLAITVRPFVWQTAGFKMGAVLLLLGISSLSAVFWARGRYRRNLELQKQRFTEEKAAQLEASNQVLRKRQLELEEAMANVKTLTGLIPICASCHSIRDDKGYWKRVETYVQDHSDATFSHGLCPRCVRKLYPGVADEMDL